MGFSVEGLGYPPRLRYRLFFSLRKKSYSGRGFYSPEVACCLLFSHGAGAAVDVDNDADDDDDGGGGCGGGGGGGGRRWWWSLI